MSDAGPEFAALASLIALVSDPKAASQRLSALEKQLDAVTKAQEKLAADRAAHDRARAELEAREHRLREREAAAGIAEGRLAAREKAIAAVRPPRFTADPTGAPGTISHSGLAREAFHG
jgi:peptidoglycan hydrolase CwlO-like protein